MGFCTSASFASVYLLSLSYTNTELGIVLATGNLLGAFLGPWASSLVDRSERISAAELLPPILILQVVMIALLLLFPVKGLVTSLAYVLFIAFSVSVNSLNLKLYTDAVHMGADIDYAFTRGMGSLAYVLLSVSLGGLVKIFSARVIPLAALFVSILQFSAFLSIRRKLPSGGCVPVKTVSHPASSIGAFLHHNRHFTVLLLGTALLFLAHNTASNFMINVVRNVGGDAGTLGLVSGFTATVEIPVMMLYHKLFGKRNPSVLLAIAFAAFVVKTFAIAMSGSIASLFSALVLQAPSFALYTSAIVPYVSETVPFEDSAKAQSLAYSMTTLGSVMASLISGYLYDHIGVSRTLWVACAFCIVGASVAFLGLGQKRRLAASHAVSGIS